jgi:hypothetical protein
MQRRRRRSSRGCGTEQKRYGESGARREEKGIRA